MGFETTIALHGIGNCTLQQLNITPYSRLPVSLPFKTCKRYHFSCHPETSSCLLGKVSDLLWVDLVPPPSHSSHLILEQYQDRDLPLTSREGTDTKGRTPHFITQCQAVEACQTIPLASSQKPGDSSNVLNQPQLPAHFNILSPPKTSMRSWVSIYNELTQSYTQLLL